MSDDLDIRVNGGDLRVTGVSRDAENSKVAILYLTRQPTDDELRAIRDVFGPSRFVSRPESALERAARNATRPVGLKH